MSLISRFPRSTRKQTTEFLLASLVTACVMPRSGTLKRQEPLQKYLDILTLPMAKSRLVLNKTSPRGKSDRCRTLFALNLAKHPDLSEAQKVIILDGMSFVTPERFELRSDSPE